MAVLAGSLSWLIGISAALSFNVWADLRPMAAVPFLADKNIFDILDFSIANLLLPLNAFLIAIFAGWMMTRQSLLEELGVQSVALSRFLNIVLRYVAPVLIFAIFYTSLT
jgi:NSS family neurotransmitter:Na+ symporter